MNKINLVEGTHFRRRFNHPSHVSHKSKELVSCLFSNTSSFPDDEEHAGERVGKINKRCKGVLRLNKLTKHIKYNHADCIPS